jgi:hypothetical protein
MTPEYPAAADHIPSYVREAWRAADEPHAPRTAIDPVMEWLLYGDRNAEQYPEDTPQERYDDLCWWRGLRQPVWYLNFYTQHQEYGGPEEGGWWYWVDTPIPTIPQFDFGRGPEGFQAAHKFRTGSAQHYIQNFKGIDDPDQVEMSVERHPARVYPQHRPHYC